jgi:hypothetical protein
MPAVSLVKFLDRKGTVCYPLTEKKSRNSARAVCFLLLIAFVNRRGGGGGALGLRPKLAKHEDVS